MKKIFAVIFLLVAAYLFFATLSFFLYSFQTGDLGEDSPEEDYRDSVVIISCVSTVVFILTWLAITWLRTPPKPRSNAIDDHLIEK